MTTMSDVVGGRKVPPAVEHPSGGVAERLNATDLKSVDARASEGSNPSPFAKLRSESGDEASPSSPLSLSGPRAR